MTPPGTGPRKTPSGCAGKTPLPAFRGHLIASGVLDDEAAAHIDAEADKAVTAAVDFADASPAPDVATLFDHVYATPAASVYRGLPGNPVGGEDAHDGAQLPAGPA